MFAKYTCQKIANFCVPLHEYSYKLLKQHNILKIFGSSNTATRFIMVSLILLSE